MTKTSSPTDITSTTAELNFRLNQQFRTVSKTITMPSEPIHQTWLNGGTYRTSALSGNFCISFVTNAAILVGLTSPYLSVV